MRDEIPPYRAKYRARQLQEPQYFFQSSRLVPYWFPSTSDHFDYQSGSLAENVRSPPSLTPFSGVGFFLGLGSVKRVSLRTVIKLHILKISPGLTPQRWQLVFTETKLAYRCCGIPTFWPRWYSPIFHRHENASSNFFSTSSQPRKILNTD